MNSLSDVMNVVLFVIGVRLLDVTCFCDPTSIAAHDLDIPHFVSHDVICLGAVGGDQVNTISIRPEKIILADVRAMLV